MTFATNRFNPTHLGAISQFLWDKYRPLSLSRPQGAPLCGRVLGYGMPIYDVVAVATPNAPKCVLGKLYYVCDAFKMPAVP
jgi:hypothetical protein